MAVKSIIEIDVADGAFQKFAAQFKAYQDALTKTNGTWDEAVKRIDGTRQSFSQLVALAEARLRKANLIAEAENIAADRIKRQADAQKWVTEQTTFQARAWRDMAHNSKGFASHIAGATRSLLQWGSLTGIISGVLGAGGLFGIDRLAQSVGGQRRSALGLGVTPGEQSAFSTDFGRLVNPDQFLGGVNEALHDVTKRVGLYGAGLTENDLRGKDTGQVGAELIPALKKIADQTPESMLGNVLKARHLDQFISLEDFERLKHTPAGEVAAYGRQYQEDRRGLDLTKGQQKAWQDLQVQLTRAGKQIERTFVIGLTDLAGPIGRLSASFVGVVDAFSKSPQVKRWIDDIATDLDSFAGKIGTPQFRNSVTSFADDMGTLATNLRADLPGITTVFNAIAALGNGIGAAAGPWINGRPPDPNNPLPNDPPSSVPPQAPPFSYWNPGSWLHHSAYRSGASSSFATSAIPASYRTFLPSAETTGRITRAHDFFRAAGWTEAQTDGLLGNARAESGFNPNAFNGAGGGQGAQGLFQWRGDRIDQFRRMFGHDPRHGTEDEQLMFAQWELTHTEKRAGDRLRALGNTAGAAGRVVNEDYERSGTGSGARAHAAEQYGHRFKDRSVQVQIHNNTGGNAVVTLSQLSV